ncbi:DNA-directed RNA polymerase 2B, chloroplastic/mitochondrial [Tanacetum coccineum]
MFKGVGLILHVKGRDDSKPWSQPVKAQVGSRRIKLLLQSAYIQPPADQSARDIRPAFVHTFRTSVKGECKDSFSL